MLKNAELATISFTLMKDISLNTDQPVQVEPDAKQTLPKDRKGYGKILSDYKNYFDNLIQLHILIFAPLNFCGGVGGT